MWQQTLTVVFSLSFRFINQENVTEQTEDDDGEELEEEEDGNYVTNSPEPPEPVEPDETMQIDENGQPGSLHPEQEMRHVFQVGEPQLESQWILLAFPHTSCFGGTLTCWLILIL